MRIETLDCDLTSSHWGAYEVGRHNGKVVELRSWAQDPEPSPIGLAMLDAYRSPLRIQRPAVRAGWLKGGAAAGGEGRGNEPFVEISWDRAHDLVAGELKRVIASHGNSAIFGGSYGWSSAGRFHHAQSQVHRFLNVLGGYVRHTDSYSLGAGRVVMPHVVASMDELMAEHHAWEVLQEHTRLFVAFGGVPVKNAQVGSGGASHHRTRSGLAKLAQAGCRFVHISASRDQLEAPAGTVEWIPIRPNTDTAVMLALAHELLITGKYDEEFLRSHCTGFERWRDYLLGADDGIAKTVDWAATISEVPAARLRKLASELAATRSFINVTWSLQRADHGEQPFWAAVGLASELGQIGLPGGGFGVGYGTANMLGSAYERLPGPVLPQGMNKVEAFIPCARVSDMLLKPGQAFDYNGQKRVYPDIRLVYWAGGNPFHHHQDLNRLAQAWKKPETIVVHEQVWNAHARMADIVLPATSTLERDDIGHSLRDALLIAMKAVEPPPGEARDDYGIFADLSARFGKAEDFTEGRDVRQWVRHLYETWRDTMTKRNFSVPDFDTFWSAGALKLPASPQPVVMLEAFRDDPIANPLKTPSGRIELFSEKVASFGYDDCPGYPAWFEPAEWLGSAKAKRHPLHMISDQPERKLHSQLDFSSYSLGRKVAGREPVMINPQDAAARGICDGDVVRIFNDRGACLAGAVIADEMRQGVIKLSTGAWWDPDRPGKPDALDRHGNPNALTRDAGASSLSQGCSAQTCLVEVMRYDIEDVPMRAFEQATFAES